MLAPRENLRSSRNREDGFISRLAPKRAFMGVRRRLTRKPRAHLLHVTKTGGSAMKTALRPVELAGRYHLVLHRPPTRLADVPAGEKFFFAVRDPLTRFVSGFYSRQRKGGAGEPRPWRPREVPVFTRFHTPNELAESLSSTNDDVRHDAVSAMGAIHHFQSQWHWLGDEVDLASRREDVLLVLFQSRLDQDFGALTSRLGVSAKLPSDERAHRTPPSLDRRLSETAEANLRGWYERDYNLMAICEQFGVGGTPG